MGALQGQGLGAESADGVDAAGVFDPQRVKASGGQRLLLATDALHFADLGVGIQLGMGEKLAFLFLNSEISA